jgi:hypothetical protein
MSSIPHPKKLLKKTSSTISTSLFTLRGTSSLIQVLLAIVLNLLLSTHMTTIGITVACRLDGYRALGGISTARCSLSSIRSWITGMLYHSSHHFSPISRNTNQFKTVEVQFECALFTQTRFGTGTRALIISTHCIVGIREESRNSSDLRS